MRTTTFFTLLATQLLLSTVNAISNSVSLLSFAPAPANLTPVCNSQYDATINGCSTADFAQGASCTSSCLRALLETQTNIRIACFDVPVGAKTLLGEIFQNQILQALCGVVPLATTTSNQASTEAAQSTTSKAAATTSTTTSTTDSASSAVQTAPNSVQTTSSATTDAAGSSSTSSALTVASISAASAPPPSDTPTGAQVAPKLTSQQIQIQALAYSGGGSPFDIISSSDADKKTMSSFAAVIVVGAIMMLAR